MKPYTAFCDGGCYTSKEGFTTPSYFSYQIWDSKKLQIYYNNSSTKPLAAMDCFYLRNLLTSVKTKHDEELLLPLNCSIFTVQGKETNNIAEYAALYYCIQKAKLLLPPQTEIEILSDSQLIINQVLDNYACNSAHLIPWYTAVKYQLNNLQITLTHTPREYIERMLGH
jgi:ribonuclease HI